MEPSELLRRLAETLERLGIAYLVTGSMASGTYGEPRFTNDIDVIVVLPAEKVAAFCAAFPGPEFYCDPGMVADAVRDQFQFNILHPDSGLKVDVILAKDSPFDRSRLSRARRVVLGPQFSPSFASPEDVILKKLEFYREGGSEKHIRDILGVLKVQGDRVDRAYITDWANRLGLTAEWDLVLAQLTPPTEGGTS
jgi:hypothetical protein